MTIRGQSLTQRNNKTNNSRTLRRDPPTRTCGMSFICDSVSGSTPYNPTAPKQKKMRKKIKKKKVAFAAPTSPPPTDSSHGVSPSMSKRKPILKKEPEVVHYP